MLLIDADAVVWFLDRRQKEIRSEDEKGNETVVVGGADADEMRGKWASEL